MLKTSRWVRPVMAGTATIAIVTALAACGSAQSASTGGGTASAASTASSNASDSGSMSRVVASYEKAPTAIPITTPLETSPPKGKTFVFLQCDVAQCTEDSTALKAATAGIGWNLKV